MQPSDREDCLEAILNIITEQGRNATIPELSRIVSLDDTIISNIIRSLEKEGHVVVLPDGSVNLTESGMLIAQKVVRKHCILECFLSEMLGMDEEKASKEACILEHDVSDETIDRLSSYIKEPCPIEQPCSGEQPCPWGGRWGKRRWREGRTTVLDFEEGAEVEVVMVRGLGWNRRLIDLGIVPGEKLKIKRKLRNRSILVKVKGCDVALSPEVGRSIFVERTG